MFNKLAQYQAYTNASHTVSKIRQVVMLYDGAIRFMRQVQEAIEQNRIEDRYNLLVRASEIIMGLQGCIDFEKGGSVAPLLYDYYASLDARIMTIHRTGSREMCQQIVKELKQMRDAWDAIDNQTASAQAQAQAVQKAAAAVAVAATATATVATAGAPAIIMSV